MAQPRPSLTLILDLDERVYSEDLKLEINRCYAYVAPTLIRTHPAPTAAEGEEAPEPENIMRFLIKMGTRKYLSKTDAEADALWNDVMLQWVLNSLTRVGNNMRIFNRRQEQEGRDELKFDWVEFEFENGRLNTLLHCDNVCGLDPETGRNAVIAVRDAWNDGTLGPIEGEGAVKKVWMPSRESWAAQLAVGEEIARKRAEEEEAARIAAEEAAEAARIAAEEEADESFLESPELTEEEAAEAAAEAGEETTFTIEGPDGKQHEVGGGEDIDALYALKEADFAVRYGNCTIEYADGTSKTVQLFDDTPEPEEEEPIENETETENEVAASEEKTKSRS